MQSNSSVFIPGRLVGQKPRSSNSYQRQELHSAVDSLVGSDHQSGEVETDPFSEFHLYNTGMEFLTSNNMVRFPWGRIQGILLLISWFRLQKTVTARTFLSLLGKLSAAAQFVSLGRLHLCLLQMALFAQWEPHVLPLEHKISITDNILFHLHWWNYKHRFIQGVPIKSPPHAYTLFMDASVSGWGAHLDPEGLLCHGVWTPDQSQLHINILEMKAILSALKQCQDILANSLIMVATDNSSVVAYIRKEGGTHSPSLCMEVWETLLWCFEKEISI